MAVRKCECGSVQKCESGNMIYVYIYSLYSRPAAKKQNRVKDSPHQSNFENPITAGSVVALLFSAVIYSTGYAGVTEIADGIAMGSFIGM